LVASIHTDGLDTDSNSRVLTIVTHSRWQALDRSPAEAVVDMLEHARPVTVMTGVSRIAADPGDRPAKR
jgi:hypothetical protein